VNVLQFSEVEGTLSAYTVGLKFFTINRKYVYFETFFFRINVKYSEVF